MLCGKRMTGPHSFLCSVGHFLAATGASNGHGVVQPRGRKKAREGTHGWNGRQDSGGQLGHISGFKRLEEVPEYGMSAGPATIADVSHVVVMQLQLIGAHKRSAFDSVAAAAA
jgi:hypothetical protein